MAGGTAVAVQYRVLGATEASFTQRLHVRSFLSFVLSATLTPCSGLEAADLRQPTPTPFVEFHGVLFHARVQLWHVTVAVFSSNHRAVRRNNESRQC